MCESEIVRGEAPKLVQPLVVFLAGFIGQVPATPAPEVILTRRLVELPGAPTTLQFIKSRTLEVVTPSSVPILDPVLRVYEMFRKGVLTRHEQFNIRNNFRRICVRGGEGGR